MDTKAAIAIGILVLSLVMVASVTLVERLRTGRCPQCASWRVRASGPVYPLGPGGDRQATTFYRCRRCGHAWSRADE